MEIATIGLLVLAAFYAVMNGMNDGGTLVANGLKIRSIRVLPAIWMVAGGVALVPLVLGTRVAETFANRLVRFEGLQGQRTVAVAVIAAVLVVFVLARRGLPTSLTLATIGGITGAGLGAGRSVELATVATVLAMAAAAPLVGAVLAYGLARIGARITTGAGLGRIVDTGHRGAFTLQCIAYGANDGQKVLAITLLAMGGTDVDGLELAGVLAAGALFFLIGTVLGVRRMAGTIGAGVLPVRPISAVTAEVAAGSAVLGSSFFGAPVSMTQAVAGALVGSGVSEGVRRVRWRLVANIVLAWLLTLPAALVVGGIMAYLTEALV